MAQPKTQKTQASVSAFLEAAATGERRADCGVVLELMKKATRCEPRMWGTSIVGFGTYPYRYAKGKALEWPVIAFSPRKQNLTLYLRLGAGHSDELLKKLGRHKTGKGCLYLNSLAAIDLKILKQLVAETVRHMKATYPTSFA